MQKEVQSALALCRAALQHCRDEQGGSSAGGPAGRPIDESDSQQDASHTSASTAPTLGPGTDDSRHASRAEKKDSGEDVAVVAAAWGTTWLTRHNGTVRSATVSPIQSLVASASGDHQVHLSQPPEAGPASTGPESPGSVVAVLRGHKHIVSGVAFSPDGMFLVSSSHDKTMRLWACHAGGAAECRHEGEDGSHQQKPWRLCAVVEGHNDAVTCVAWRSPNEMREGARAINLSFISGAADGTLALWEISLAGRDQDQEYLYGQDNMYIPCQNRGDLASDVSRAELLAILPALRFSVPCPSSPTARGQHRAHHQVQDTSEVGAQGSDGHPRWRGRCEAHWLRDCHASAVSTCVWVQHSSRFISGAADGSLAMCSVCSVGGAGHPILWRAKSHSRRVVAALVSRSGARVVSCSEDATLVVYNAADGSVTHTINMGTALALSLAWAADDECVLVATGGKRIKLFHLSSEAALGSLVLPVVRGGVQQVGLGYRI